MSFTALRATNSLAGLPQSVLIEKVLSSALEAVDPYRAVKAAVQRNGDHLTIGKQTYDLKAFQRVRVIGIGKASRPMALAIEDLLSDCLEGGLIITKHVSGPGEQMGISEVLESSHPIPDERSIQAAQLLAAFLHPSQVADLVICLLSGGGSALMTAPIPGVSLADLQALTAALLACGASIQEINTLRKHLDSVKGGGLARLAAPAALVNLVLSDVVGSPLDVIASGPTVADPTTFADAWQIVVQYHLEEKLPFSILTALQNGLAGEIPETLKPDDLVFAKVDTVLVGSNYQAASAGLEAARQAGLHTLLLTTCLQGEARFAGGLLAAVACQVAMSGEPLPRPACIVAGGETTVTLRGKGQGGRNQEVALGAVNVMAGISDALLVTLATDGEDGPTDAAGALVTGETLVRARQAGLDPALFLRENNSYAFFDSLGDLLRPGPTGTNVNDLAFLFLF